ncbi:hypothetical protein DSM107133_01057 [Pseudosulfitobacter sp. DSM 107133]|nr:hypothetical protein DSM107133_01057 [Pseudosulfitobacter sp. DSM 107133]
MNSLLRDTRYFFVIFLKSEVGVASILHHMHKTDHLRNAKMSALPHSLVLSATDFDMIESALETQEKILAVQVRAGGETAEARLTALRSVLRRLRRQRPQIEAPQGWGSIARGLFCNKNAAPVTEQRSDLVNGGPA